MDDIPNNIVVVIAIIALAAIGLIACLKDFNHGILQLIIMVISGLAGYKIKGMVDTEIINQVEKLKDANKSTET